MRRRRIIHRSDANQGDVVKALRAVGATVDVIGEPVDLLVGFRGRNYLLEVKRDAKAKLEPSQEVFLIEWRGQVARVNSPAEALAVIGCKVQVPQAMSSSGSAPAVVFGGAPAIETTD